MLSKQVAKYKALLETREQELSKGFRARNQITLPKTPEMEEEAQMLVEQDLAIENRNVAADLLRQIWAALDRIADSSYGTCLSCGREIQPQRLEAVPWAAYCTRCQEALDLKQARIASQQESVEAEPSQEEHAA
jgi:DnaK suppressor protein